MLSKSMPPSTGRLVSFGLVASIGTVLIVGSTPRLAASAMSLDLSAKDWVIAALIFVAAIVSSTIGFAFSAFAGAMLFHIEPSPARAVEIMLLASVGIQVTSLSLLWRNIEWRLSMPYLIGGLLALPLGLYALMHLEPRAYICGLGALLLVYGIIMLARPAEWIASDGLLTRMLVGGLGGITGPLAAFPAAFVGIWCGVRGFDKLVTRSIIQPYILGMQLAVLAALIATGISPATLSSRSLIFVLPGILGACVGMRIFRRMTDARYQRLVVMGLIASGAALLWK